MRSRSRLRRLAIIAAIAASTSVSTWATSTASAQYFGPRFGVRPGIGFPGFGLPGVGLPGISIGVAIPPAYSYAPRFGPGLPVPGRAIGAIPRWSRAPRVVPVYPVTSYVPRPLVPQPLVPVAPALPVAPVSPVAPVGYSYRGGSIGPFSSSVSIDANRIDIRTPGFEYRAERQMTYPEPNIGQSSTLSQSASRLAAALSARPDGEVWLDYLQPERVAMTSNPAELGELVLRYQGVMANPDLAWLANLDGFQETLQWLDPDAGLDPQPNVVSSVSQPDPGVPAQAPRSGQPTLAPALPSEEQEEAAEQSIQDRSIQDRSIQDRGIQDRGIQDRGIQDRGIQEELPAPKPEPTTSV